MNQHIAFCRSLSTVAVLFICGVVRAPAAPPYATKIYIGKNVEVSLYSPTMFRFRISEVQPERFPAKYEIPYAMGRLVPWPEVKYKRWTAGEFEWVETSALRVRVDKSDKTWTVWSVDGTKRIYPSDGPIRGMFRDGYTVFDAASAFGERNLNSRYAHWFYSFQTRRYVDTFLAGDLILDEFFIYGPGYDRLFQQLNDLVGPEPLLPKKGYGFFQTEADDCQASQTKLMELARKFRDRDIPVDTLILDLEWGDGCPGGQPKDWGRLDWYPPYSRPLSIPEMLNQLHAMHYDLMLIHHNAPNYPHRAEFISAQPGDWTQKVYDEGLWWDKIRGELAIGVDGLWQDNRQNDVSDSVIWGGIQDYWGKSRRVLFMGNREITLTNTWTPKFDRTVGNTSLLASRRYPFRWTGDLSTTWSELRFQIDAIANSQASMKGIGYLTADAFAKSWQQQARWNQFLAFSPVVRSHTTKPWAAHVEQAAESVAKNEANIKTAEYSVRKYLKLRYRLLPYIYSLAFDHLLTGMPMSRPMDVAFPNDVGCQQNRWPYQYMFGDAFLVAPVYADLRSMEIYLPQGNGWIDYWDKRLYKGGETIDYDTSDPEKLPLFVRAGSIIPMRAEANWIDPAVPDDPLYLDVYPSNQQGSFSLYEDDGVTTEYQSGRFANIVLSVRKEPTGSVTLSIGRARGSYKGQPVSRHWVITVQWPGKAPVSLIKNGVPMVSLMTPKAQPAGSEGWSYDALTHTVVVKEAQPSESDSTIVIE